MSAFARRQFLRGAFGTAIALPLLSSLPGRARAVPPAFPKRFVAMFTPHGIVRKDWAVTGTETDFTLSGILEPLEAYKKQLLILKDVDLTVAAVGAGDSHQQGVSGFLTGTPVLPDPNGSGGITADSNRPVGWGGGISVDQFLAQSAGVGTRFPSLELGVISDLNAVGGRIAYADASKPIPPVNDPALVFDRIFADLGADPTGVERVRLERKSVLDTVKSQFTRISAKVSAEDRTKLESHFAAVRDLEIRLDASGGTVVGACQKPARPVVDAADLNVFPTIGKAQMDLLVMALACDLTRVATLVWSHTGQSHAAPWLGINDGHHTLSHSGDTDVESQAKLTKYKRWYAEQFAYLVDTMSKIPEGTGTMLDNTVLLWGSEVSVGNTHSHVDMPLVLAGGCGGYFRTGRFVTYPRNGTAGASYNDLLVSLCHAMGRTDVTTFGSPAYCTGKPLPGLAAT